jgi:hypothetical protein
LAVRVVLAAAPHVRLPKNRAYARFSLASGRGASLDRQNPVDDQRAESALPDVVYASLAVANREQIDPAHRELAARVYVDQIDLPSDTLIDNRWINHKRPLSKQERLFLF